MLVVGRRELEKDPPGRDGFEAGGQRPRPRQLYLASQAMEMVVSLVLWSGLLSGALAADILLGAVRAAEALEDPECRGDVLEFLSQLGNFTLWAVNMLDASSKFPDSVTSGATYHLGNFDACLDVDSGGGVEGRYCLAEVNLVPAATAAMPSGSAWDKFKVHGDRLKVRRDELMWAVCLPASCGTRQATALLRGLLTETSPHLARLVAVRVPQHACYTRRELYQRDPAPLTARAAVFAYLLLIVVSMVYDCVYRQRVAHGSPQDAGWLSVFSPARHWRCLTASYKEKDQQKGSELGRHYLPCLDGLRVAALLVVVVGHRGEATMTGPVINGDAVEELYKNFGGALIMNGHLVVDTFFTISGFLLCWNYLCGLRDHNRRNPSVLTLCVLRYVRLSPALMAVVLFEAFFLFNVSSGPLWKLRVGAEMANCRSNWWTNALLVNNYVHPQSACIDPAWYIACDFQIFIASCVLMECMTRLGKYGLALLPAAVGVSMAVTAVLTYVKDLDPTLIPDQSTLGHNYNETYILTYITAHCRSGPYFIGMIFAYWLFSMKTKNLKMPKAVVFLGWIVCPLLAVLVIAAGLLFYSCEVNKVILAAYAGVHRTLFGMCIAFIITACAMGSGGVVANILEWKPFRPISRLTYCIFLVHHPLQMVRISMLRTPKVIDDFDLACDSISDIVLSTCFATILFLAVEQPMLTLWNKIFSAIRKHDSQELAGPVHNIKKD